MLITVKARVGKKASNTPGFELFNLRCSSSIAGLWVTFCFSLHFKLISCTSKVEKGHMNDFKN